MATNVLNLPGNYQIKALNGFVYVDAGTNVEITAGGEIINQASSGITNEALGGNIENTALGGNITNEAGADIENIASNILNEATGNFEVEAATVLNTIGGSVTSNIGGTVSSVVGGDVDYAVSGIFEVAAPEINLLSLDIQIGNGGGSSGILQIKNLIADPLTPDTDGAYDIGSPTANWDGLYIKSLDQYSDSLNTLRSTLNVGNPAGDVYDPLDVYGNTGERQTGALYIAGGVGIEKDLNVGGRIYGRIETATTSFNVLVTATNANQLFYPIFARSTGTEYLFIDPTEVESPPSSGNFVGGLTYNPATGVLEADRIVVAQNDAATSPATGALQVKGGVGVEGNVYVQNAVTASNILPITDYQNTTSVYTIGNSTTNWAEAYVQEIYTNILTNHTGTMKIQPNNPLTEIIGDIRVKGGTNPIGTYPVVSNTLYVTTDGNDTNDGRALDPSRACRTIGGAIASPFYKEGTQILVSAGFYLEDNPLRLKPYTSIRGSDIRTTFIEPINKTQDLFHVDSGCYLNYMTFLNGRSGLLEGPYEEGFNRGAYCTAFPPLEGDARIDLFHSPYIQNCTNQSGPWLRDGTMFIPNQTVQIPKAVGTGTWEANTSSLVINVDTGTIELGMSINAGQQNPGFFEARTLLLANKPFIQDQVVRYVDLTFNSGNFVYDQVKCARDTGLIIDSVAIDLLQDSESESIFAGLQYWRQSGYVDAIGSQFTATVNSITYLQGLAVSTATAAASASEGTIVNLRFADILAVINTATGTLSTGVFSEWVTNSIVSNGTATTTANVVAAYNALLASKSVLQDSTINYITANFPTLVYNTATCRRDVGYIIDSVAFDLLHGGNKQSFKSGVYYFGYSTNQSEVPNELPQTTAAYRFLKNTISEVVQGKPLVTLYQSTITQVTNLNSATIYEAEALGEKIDIITGIIRNGPEDYASVGKRIPISLLTNTSTAVTNAYNLLQANRNFLIAETIAYINTTSNYFNYNREKCRRDVGILVENISYDAAFGGNEKAVESGLAYFDGVISKISGQEVQTISAIDYLNSLAQKIIVNQTCTDLFAVGTSTTATNLQVINTALTKGSITSDSIENLVNIITTIIDNGPSAAPAVYSSPGPDSAFVSAETLMQANRSFVQQETISWINRVLLPGIYPGYFSFSEIKCRRDTGLIVDAVAQDLLYPTQGHSQSTFAGLQYWNQGDYTGQIGDQLNPTIEAIKYLKVIAGKIVQNITPADDLVSRYQTIVSQNTTTYQPATLTEVEILDSRFDEIIEIVSGNNTGWTNRITPNGPKSTIISRQNAFDNLQINKTYIAAEVNAFVTATNYGFVYDAGKCARDVGYILDSVGFDMLHNGNRQSVQSGLYYYGFSTTATNIYQETTQTIAAFNTLSYIVGQIIQNIPVQARQSDVKQVFSTTTSTITEASYIQISINTITNIIANGPNVAVAPSPINITATTTASVVTAYDLIYANKTFIIEEVIAFIDQTYNPGYFNYNEAKCFRDVGLILDAVSQDIILGGNSKSIEAGLAYWSAGYNSVAGQETTTTVALNYARDIILKVVKNETVTVTTGTFIPQVINTFFQYGEEYGPQEAIKRNFKIITDVISKGPEYAPPIYAGGGLFSLVGINGSDVKVSPKVVSLSTITTGTYRVGLDIPTVGFGINSTLYFGDTLIFPYRDKEVDEKSFEYTGNTSTWAQRKIDPVGGMGGSLVDGAVISDRSPIQSFVYDAFTQLTQGGRGVHIIRDGYAQLVSVFTIFASVGVEVESGGIASIVNSNANFGNICLQASGFGKRKFTGHIYNPSFKAYPESPVGLPGSEELNQYYPSGYWPNDARVMVFLPDLDDRPHISLVMEVVPPETVRDFTGELVAQRNEQGFPGFLNASPTTSSLTTSSITISGIDTTGIAVGNYVYARDQFGRTTSTQTDVNGNWMPYIASGTVVTNIEYLTVTLSQPVLVGGADPDNTAGSINDNYFDLYFSGNAYYTVLSSEVASLPQYNRLNATIPDSVNILSEAALGLTGGQVSQHIAALEHLNTLTRYVLTNTPIISLQTGTSTTTQFINLLVQGGGNSIPFVDLRFDDMIDIIGAANLTAAEAVVPLSLRKTTGPAVQGAGSAVNLIESNIEFLADEVSAYVQNNFFGTSFVSYSADELAFVRVKCQRDTKIILQRLIYDIETGGNYNMILSGLSYWRRNGSYHIVSLGEGVTRTDLFPDGATVNFYQRSYMSASGYVFEYVGAGIDYGSLPQRGIADPKQGQEVVQLNSGKVFFTSTDQNGDFRIGPGLVISQATGVLSGRTFTRSLFANLTPFILAIESGGG